MISKRKIVNKIAVGGAFIIVFMVYLETCTMNKTFLDGRDVEWYKCYNRGDTLIFESDIDQRRLIVRYHKMRNPKNHNPFDTEGELETFVLFTPFVIIMPHEIFGYISVGLCTETDSVRSFACMYSKNYSTKYERKYCVGHANIEEILKAKFIVRHFLEHNTGLSFNDTVIRYKDYLQRYGDKDIKQSVRDSITDFVWTKNRGLISFTIRDTTTYNLIKHIKHEPVIPIKQLHK